MIVQFKSRLIETLEKYSDLNSAKSHDNLNPESIGLVIGICAVCLLTIFAFTFIAYFFPYWCFYTTCLDCFVRNPFCNFIYCYYNCCSFLDKEVLGQIEASKMKSQIYIQDLVTTPNGRVIHLSNMRQLNKNENGNFSRQYLESEIV